MSANQEITRLLQGWNDGDEQALEKLTPVLYRELHRMAHRYMRQERPGHTLQTPALINAAYIRLIGWKNVRGQNRAHFFGVSAQLMRKILVDFARSRNYAKRGADARAVSAVTRRCVCSRSARVARTARHALTRIPNTSAAATAAAAVKASLFRRKDF